MRVLSLVMMTVVLHPQMIGWAVKPPTRNNSQFGIGSDSVFVNLSIVSDSVFVKLNQNKTNTETTVKPPTRNNSQFGIGSESVFVNLSIVSDSVFVKLNQNKTNTETAMLSSKTTHS